MLGAATILVVQKSWPIAVEDISPIVIERFARTMHENLTTGEVAFPQGLLGSVLDRIEVDDREVGIVGRKEVLEQAVLAARQGEALRHALLTQTRRLADWFFWRYRAYTPRGAFAYDYERRLIGGVRLGPRSAAQTRHPWHG